MPETKTSRVCHGTPRRRRRPAIPMIGVFLLSSFAAITQGTLIPEGFAQEHIHADHGPFEPLIDGSDQPESVPDNVAIRILMQTLRESINAGPGLAQLYTRVQRANLGDADIQILVRELGELDTRAKDQEARIEAVRPSSETPDSAAIDRYVEEQADLGNLIVDHYQQLLASLSPEGAAKLQEHLLHIKSRIKIYPTPDMSASDNRPGEDNE